MLYKLLGVILQLNENVTGYIFGKKGCYHLF